MSAPPSTSFHPPSGHSPPPPPSPSDTVGWTTTLDRRERADKSLHGDSAFCKSCCGRRVFSFPPSVFPFSSLHCCQPRACTQPVPSFFLPSCVLFCVFSASYPHFLLQFEKPLSRDRHYRGRGGWGRHNVHLTFNQRLSQHAASEQTG